MRLPTFPQMMSQPNFIQISESKMTSVDIWITEQWAEGTVNKALREKRTKKLWRYGWELMRRVENKKALYIKIQLNKATIICVYDIDEQTCSY